MQLVLERLRLKRETNRSAGEGGETNQARGTHVVFGGARFHDLPHLVDGKMTLIVICYDLKDKLMCKLATN